MMILMRETIICYRSCFGFRRESYQPFCCDNLVPRVSNDTIGRVGKRLPLTSACEQSCDVKI